MFVPVPLITPFSLFGDQVMTIAAMAHEPCDQHGYKLCGQHGREPHSKHVANMIYVTPNIKRLMIDSLIISPLFDISSVRSKESVLQSAASAHFQCLVKKVVVDLPQANGQPGKNKMLQELLRKDKHNFSK